MTADSRDSKEFVEELKLSSPTSPVSMFDRYSLHQLDRHSSVSIIMRQSSSSRMGVEEEEEEEEVVNEQCSQRIASHEDEAHLPLDDKQLTLLGKVIHETNAKPDPVWRMKAKLETLLDYSQSSGNSQDMSFETRNFLLGDYYGKHYSETLPIAKSLSENLVSELRMISGRIEWPSRMFRLTHRERVLSVDALDMQDVAFEALNRLICDIRTIAEMPSRYASNPPFTIFEETMIGLMSLCNYYEQWMCQLCQCSREQRIHLLKDPVSMFVPGFGHFVIDCEMAYSMIGRDKFGMQLASASTHSGSHNVTRKGDVFFKSHLAFQGLDHSMEEAVYSFSQTFNSVEAKKCFAPTAFVVLNQVVMQSPDSRISSRFVQAVKGGQSSEEYFLHYPGDERLFVDDQELSEQFLQISEAIPGVTLDTVFSKSEDVSQIQLHEDQFAWAVTLNAVLAPNDGKPDNYILTPDNRVVGIDNDMCLQNQVVFQRTTPYVGIRCCLFMLPQLDRRISSRVAKEFLTINPALQLAKWCNNLVEYQKLLFMSVRSDAVRNALYLPMKFVPGTAERVFQSLYNLKNATAMNDLNLWDILKTIHPIAGQAYETYHELFMRQFRDTITFSMFDVYDTIHQSDCPSLAEIFRDKPHLLRQLELMPQVKGTDYEQKKSLAVYADFQTVYGNDSLIDTCTTVADRVQIFSFLSTASLSVFGHPSSIWFSPDVFQSLFRENLSLEAHQYFHRKTLDALEWKLEPNGYTALHLCIIHSVDVHVFQYYLSRCPQKVNVLDRSGNTPLGLCLSRKDTRSINFIGPLLKAGSIVRDVQEALASFRFVENSVGTDSAVEMFSVLCNSNTQFKWLLLLDLMLPSTSYTKLPINQRGTEVFGTESGERFLTKEVQGQIFNEKKLPIRKNAKGKCIVSYADWKNSNMRLYFKFFPQLPGIEAAVSWIGRQFHPSCTSWNELFKINGRPVLVSLGIDGDMFESVIHKTESSKFQESSIDEACLSASIILSSLTNPEDGQPANFILEKAKPGSARRNLVSIDNDHNFFPSVAKSFFKEVYYVKSIVFCLDAMNKEIHPDIRQKLLEIDAGQFLSSMLVYLDKINSRMITLFGDAKYCYEKIFKDWECFLGVPLRPRLLTSLYEKIIRLQNLLRKSASITHFEVLSVLEPRIADRYKQAHVKSSSPYHRFKYFISNRDFGNLSSQSLTTITKSGQVLLSTEIKPLLSTFEMIAQNKQFSPQAAMEELDQVLSESKSSIDDLPDSKFCSRLKGIVDLSLISSSERNQIYKSIERESPKRELLEFLFLRKSDIFLFRPEFLKPWNLQTLEVLDLSYSKGVSELVVERIATSSPHLEVLNLLGVDGLSRIGPAILQRQSKKDMRSKLVFADESSRDALVFPSLKVLNVAKNSSLASVCISAPALISFDSYSCPRLSYVMIHAPKLKKWDSHGNETLRDESIHQVLYQAQDLKDYNFSDCSGFALYRRLNSQERSYKRVITHIDKQVTDKILNQIDTVYHRLDLLSSLRYLVTLRLADNHVSDEGISRIASWSQECPSLKFLGLKNNLVTSSGLLCLLENSRVSYIDIRDNPVNAIEQDALKSAIERNSCSALCYVKVDLKKLGLIDDDVVTDDNTGLTSGACHTEYRPDGSAVFFTEKTIDCILIDMVNNESARKDYAKACERSSFDGRLEYPVSTPIVQRWLSADPSIKVESTFASEYGVFCFHVGGNNSRVWLHHMVEDYSSLKAALGDQVAFIFMLRRKVDFADEVATFQKVMSQTTCDAIILTDVFTESPEELENQELKNDDDDYVPVEGEEEEFYEDFEGLSKRVHDIFQRRSAMLERSISAGTGSLSAFSPNTGLSTASRRSSTESSRERDTHVCLAGDAQEWNKALENIKVKKNLADIWVRGSRDSTHGSRKSLV